MFCYLRLARIQTLSVVSFDINILKTPFVAVLRKGARQSGLYEMRVLHIRAQTPTETAETELTTCLSSNVCAIARICD